MQKNFPALRDDPWSVVPRIPVDRLIDADDRIDSDWDTLDHVARLRAMMPEMTNLPDGTLLHLWYSFSMDWMCVGCQHERTAQFVEYLIAVLVQRDREIHGTHQTFLSTRAILNGMYDGLSFDEALNASTASHDAAAC
jgi:hypothetical protein